VFFKQLWSNFRLFHLTLNEIRISIQRVSGPSRRWNSLRRQGLVIVGSHTYGTPNVFYWDDQTKLFIGNFCSIAEGVTFILGGEHRMDWVTTYPFNVMPETWPAASTISGHPATKGDIVIGNDVWIGQNALILSGVKVGDGAIVGAGAVVSKDIPDFAVVAGNPATVVKYRFSNLEIDQIKKSSWWNWTDEKILESVEKLQHKPSLDFPN
jgi:acetyltransferase-like isoleucine patch superfamily enzyme